MGGAVARGSARVDPRGGPAMAEQADVARADGVLQVGDQPVVVADLAASAGLVDRPADAARGR